MKTIRTLIIALAATLGITATAPADVQIGAELKITPRPRGDLEVYVWPDRGMDAVYYPGERINVNVEVTRDAFLILYNIDTQGRLHILFPASPWDDNFVEAGNVISFPRSWDDFDWTVDGPPGTEYIQAIASEIPIGLPEWPIYLKHVEMPPHISADPSIRDFRSGADRYAYIDVVNRNISGRYYDWCAFDVATFYVHPQPRYYRVNDYDPWPDVFYGEVYIGWPIGSRIYIDGIFIGIAPCWIPRHYIGRHIITCYDGPRLIRRHEVRCFPKRDYYVHNQYRGRTHVVYKRARPDVYDHFRIEKDYGSRQKYRVYDRDDDRHGNRDVIRWKADSDSRYGKPGKKENAKAKRDPQEWRDYDFRTSDKVIKPQSDRSESQRTAKVESGKVKRSSEKSTSKFEIKSESTRSDGAKSAKVERSKEKTTSKFNIRSAEKHKSGDNGHGGKRSKGRD